MLRNLIDISTYWSQIILILAIAVERYILIVKGVEAKQLLNKKKRQMYYCVVLLICVLLPVLVVLDYNQNISKSHMAEVSRFSGLGSVAKPSVLFLEDLQFLKNGLKTVKMDSIKHKLFFQFVCFSFVCFANIRIQNLTMLINNK